MERIGLYLLAMGNQMVLQGRSISQEDTEHVRDMIICNPGWNRTRVSKELCRRWEWFNHLGQMKDMAYRSLVLKLEVLGYLTLPERLEIVAYRAVRWETIQGYQMCLSEGFNDTHVTRKLPWSGMQCRVDSLSFNSARYDYVRALPNWPPFKYSLCKVSSGNHRHLARILQLRCKPILANARRS